MKVYYDSAQLRMVGKAWEIRGKLRELAHHPMTVKEFLARRTLGECGKQDKKHP